MDLCPLAFKDGHGLLKGSSPLPRWTHNGVYSLKKPSLAYGIMSLSKLIKNSTNITNYITARRDNSFMSISIQRWSLTFKRLFIFPKMDIQPYNSL
ncbi:unnamed protein product [Cuscuta campestris]|uniref:Uncharacterized protein n=1 Tax=Cuscuta campestris TaxID=132261 RepID=A0A484LEA3_9ASTE|nr:unnamed protein product [Cuscuta campestris]